MYTNEPREYDLEFKISMDELLTFYAGDFIRDECATHNAYFTVYDALHPEGIISTHDCENLFGECNLCQDMKSDDIGFKELCEDLRVNGQRFPVLVNQYDGNWILHNGHHRIAAMILVGIEEVLCTQDELYGWSDS